MYDQFDNTQQVADRLKELIGMISQPSGDAYERTMRSLHVFERTGWNLYAFGDAVSRCAPGLAVNEDGQFYYAGQQLPEVTLTEIRLALEWYQHEVGPSEQEVSSSTSPRLFSTEKAAEYLGLKMPLMKYHIHKSKRLKGQKVGHSLVFTQNELDQFKATERKPGRPVKS
ncbi:MAG: hypothetical protein JXB07_18975 [Anaerolineae bacterium]|nr:hypothetical protein [Anaerolineae bacterium]